MNPISKILMFGEGRKLKKYETTVAKINALESAMHVVTANDYLARRDAEQMGRVYRLLDMTAGTPKSTRWVPRLHLPHSPTSLSAS